MKYLPEQDSEWWYTYMRNNAWYLADRIEKMVQAMEEGDEEYQEFSEITLRRFCPTSGRR